jgi:hypothetical protein
MEQGTFLRYLAVLVAVGAATVVWVGNVEEVCRHFFDKPDQYSGAATVLRLAVLWIIVKWVWRTPRKEAQPVHSPAHMRAMSWPAKVNFVITKRLAV